jgi:hypothetical protein
MPGYHFVGTPGQPHASITCHQCGRTSHNRHDVLNRYCGFCHVFHEGGASPPPTPPPPAAGLEPAKVEVLNLTSGPFAGRRLVLIDDDGALGLPNGDIVMPRSHWQKIQEANRAQQPPPQPQPAQAFEVVNPTQGGGGAEEPGPAAAGGTAGAERVGGAEAAVGEGPAADDLPRW